MSYIKNNFFFFNVNIARVICLYLRRDIKALLCFRRFVSFRLHTTVRSNFDLYFLSSMPAKITRLVVMSFCCRSTGVGSSDRFLADN